MISRVTTFTSKKSKKAPTEKDDDSFGEDSDFDDENL